MFNFFKKNKNKENNNMATTLDEVKKAYEDLSDEDKEAFKQSLKDRVDESVGEQEAENGEKDTQTAADREHEALGAEHADGEGETEELHETDEGEGKEAAEKKAEEAHEAEQETTDEKHDGQLDALFEKIAELEAKVAKLTGEDKLDQERIKYGLSPKHAGEKSSVNNYSDEDVNKLASTW